MMKKREKREKDGEKRENEREKREKRQKLCILEEMLKISKSGSVSIVALYHY